MKCPKLGSEAFSQMTKREQKRRPKPKDGTILACGVCGDRALGYNFDAISCESCKAFFRRNALKVKPFKCSFDGNCKLDPHTRKFCSGCRLKKCFTVGMKKEWILDADQLVRRRQRQQTRYQQVQSGSISHTDIQPCSSTSGDHSFPDGFVSYSPRSLDNGSFNSLGLSPSSSSEAFLPMANCPQRGPRSPPPSTYHPDPRSLQSPVMVVNSTLPGSTTNNQPAPPPHHLQFPSHYFPPAGPTPSKMPKLQNIRESELSRPHIAQPELLPPPPPLQEEPSSSSVNMTSDFIEFNLLNMKQERDVELDGIKDMPIPLTPYLKDCLESLLNLYNDIFEESYKADQAPKMFNPKSGDQLYNMTEIFIRRLIRFARHIPEFKCLTQHDQIHLLKGGIMEMFSLRSVMSFDAQNASWKFKIDEKDSSDGTSTGPKEGKLNPASIKVLGNSMYKTHMTFVLEMQELSGKDRIILMLLFVIELLSPDRPNLLRKDVVLQGQERHSSWLRSYLESLHPISKANDLFSKLMEKLMDVRGLGEASCKLVMHIDISKLEPLLLEVFDLNK